MTKDLGVWTAQDCALVLIDQAFAFHEFVPYREVWGYVQGIEETIGEAGAARYRELAHARWASVPALEPGEGSRERYGSRFRITRIMEALAEQTSDLSGQIAVRERDLGSPYNLLQIAELW